MGIWDNLPQARFVDRLCAEHGTTLESEIRHLLEAGVSNRGIARHLAELTDEKVVARSVDRWVEIVKARQG